MQAVILGEPGTGLLLGLGILFCGAVVLVVAAGALIYYFSSRRAREKSPPDVLPPVSRPLATQPPAPAAPAEPPVSPADLSKTEVMPRKCPQCHASLPADAPEGLCPACLLQRGFATENGAPTAQPGFEPPPMEELAKLFPQLEILECLGRGGMGAVYKTRQPRLDRFVALKILAPEKQHDPQFAERFEREARALARLNHPNIVTVFDFGEVAGRFYLLMEFVDGLTLRQVLQGRKLAATEALSIVPKICEALQYAHEHGIVHRDIKPENILLDKQGRVKIADFGIAKIAGLESKDFSLTGAKDVMGTPHYMAPEQLEQPQTVDHRADIYSLGVVFYEMLTGELPLGKFAPPSQKVNVDVRLDEVVLHALEKEPARRYQHASQVKTDVETVTSSTGAGGPAPAPLLPDARTVNNDSDKNILPAFLLAFFFGVFGAHRFYVGKIWTACLQLAGVGGCIALIIACATLGELGQPVTGIALGFLIVGCLIWATIDWLLLVCKAFTDDQGKRLTHWVDPVAGAAYPAATPQPGQSPNPLQPMNQVAADRSGLINAPAVALLIVAGWKLMNAFSGMLVLAGVGGWIADIAGLGNFFAPWGSMAIFSLLLFKLLPSLLILFGACQMLQRRSYGWAVAAGILAIISCSLIGFPVGIWALIVLVRDDVRAAFGGTVPPTGTVPPPASRFWRGFAVVIGSVILIPVVLGLLFVLAAMVVPAMGASWNRADKATIEQLAQAGIHQEAGGEFRKEFTQSFPFNENGEFRIDNVKGKIEIQGWNSNAVTITATIHGKTGESVQAVKIKVDSALDQASVHTDQPSRATGFSWRWPWRKNDASVEYTIQVPPHAELAGISSVNGRINIGGVAGNITASTVNGEMQIKEAPGNLKLDTVNGRISADLSVLDSGQTVKLEAVNGTVELAVPEAASANISVSTVNGQITSEFPALKPKKEFPVGNNLDGSLGQGGAAVNISAVNGTVKIVKRRPATAPAPSPAIRLEN